MTHAVTPTNLERVVDESRGGAVRARREHLGMTVSALAKLADVDRGKLAKWEAGEDHPTERWMRGVERALENFETEVGVVPGEAAAAVAPDAGFIRFKVEGVYGAKALVVEGPVENLAELEEMVDRVMRRLAGGDDAPTEG